MRARDMFLRNDRCLFYFFIIIIFLFSNASRSNTDDRNKILNYLSNLKYFSASFLQNDGENLSEGKVHIGKKRVRVEYTLPTKILIILDENKAMYYDYELEEDEFFNPKNTNAWFFYDFFRNPIFFEDSKIKIKNNEVVLEKNGINFEDKEFIIKAYFENNPLFLRSIEVIIDKDVLKLSIYNHAYNQEFNKNFFKLINPSFLN